MPFLINNSFYEGEIAMIDQFITNPKKKSKPRIKMIGRKFGRLTVLKEAEKQFWGE